jgi:hypothetical protein
MAHARSPRASPGCSLDACQRITPMNASVLSYALMGICTAAHAGTTELHSYPPLVTIHLPIALRPDTSAPSISDLSRSEYSYCLSLRDGIRHPSRFNELESSELDSRSCSTDFRGAAVRAFEIRALLPSCKPTRHLRHLFPPLYGHPFSSFVVCFPLSPWITLVTSPRPAAPDLPPALRTPLSDPTAQLTGTLHVACRTCPLSSARIGPRSRSRSPPTSGSASRSPSSRRGGSCTSLRRFLLRVADCMPFFVQAEVCAAGVSSEALTEIYISDPVVKPIFSYLYVITFCDSLVLIHLFTCAVAINYDSSPAKDGVLGCYGSTRKLLSRRPGHIVPHLTSYS